MDPSTLKSIKLTNQAGKYLAMITKGCLKTTITEDTYSLLKNHSVSLIQIRPDMPMTTGCLLELSCEKDENPISDLTVFELFGGKKHLRDAFEKIDVDKNPYFNSFKGSMKALKINLDSEINRWIFFVSDILLIGEVVSVKGNTANIIATNKQIYFKNTAIPGKISLQPKDKVMIHNGFVVCKVNSKMYPVIGKIISDQDNDKKFQQAINFLARIDCTIDFSNFCPNSKRKGCNLTIRQLEKINS